ncbi:MAG: hypothetical protein K0M56_00950 [Kaistella sp.]|nr:hypothetical protein [Kaistella sp.]
MKEFLEDIDNWYLIKLLGGFSLILIGLLKFFSDYFLKKLNSSSDHFYNKNLERIKGEILKNNTLLTSLTENHLSSSQKILDKKIQSYDILWSTILKIKESLPSGVSIVHKILIDSEITDDNAYKRFSTNPLIGKLISSYNGDLEMNKIIALGNPIYQIRPYLSDTAFNLFYTYHGVVGRLCYKFLEEYSKERIYNWKTDPATKQLLKTTLTESEINYINSINIASFDTLLELLEYKILVDLKSNLKFNDSTKDTIEHLKDIEDLLNAKLSSN